MKYIRKMKYILKKKSKVEDFRWTLYFHCYEDKSITYYGLALTFKNRPEIPVYGNHKHYIMSTKEIQEAANMYLKSQGFIRDKYTWLDRSAHLCEYSKIECSTNHIDVEVECCPECLKRQAEEYEQRIAELEQQIEELK